MSVQSPKKVASFSWQIEGSDYTRNVAFKALKADEKLGFGLGGQGKRTEVVVVRQGSQAYWKGIQKGYKVVTVNGNKVNDITVKSSLKDVATGTKDFTIGFLVPDKPDWPDKNKAGVGKSSDDANIPVDEKPKKQIEEKVKEESGLEEENSPIIENGPDYKEEKADDSGLFKGDVDDLDYESLTKKIDELKVENIDQETLEKASKEELEELKRRKQEEYEKLKAHQDALRELIKKKEKEFKEMVTRQNLEELKSMRKTAKDVATRIKRTLDELERIRRMLELRMQELAKGIQDLAAASAERDRRLSEMEAQIRELESQASLRGL